MFPFRKSVLSCLGWLAGSELICLVMAFSFALLPQSWARWLSLAFCSLAHCLLMSECGAAAAKRDLAVYRNEKKQTSRQSPLLLGAAAAVPRCLLYGILWIMRDSSLMLNVFLLLEAPYIQIQRLVTGGTEPFSALSPVRQLLMGLPPLMTVFSVYIGYLRRYAPALASEKVKTSRV